MKKSSSTKDLSTPEGVTADSEFSKVFQKIRKNSIPNEEDVVVPAGMRWVESLLSFVSSS